MARTTADAHAELVRRLFDAKAPAWAAKYAAGGTLAGRLSAVGLPVARQVPPGGLVLDLGCGTGEMSRWLAGHGLRVVGCDISPEMLRRAAAAGRARPPRPGGPAAWVLLEPGWRRLPVAASRFDAVVASSMLEYVTDPGAVLAECARALRPGGVVVCTVPDLRHPVRWLERLLRPVAGGPAWPAAPGRWQSYRRYLRASRQRHRLRWWLAAAGRAGLAPAPGAAGPGTARPPGRPRTLRVLCLQAGARPPACGPRARPR